MVRIKSVRVETVSTMPRIPIEDKLLYTLGYHAESRVVATYVHPPFLECAATTTSLSKTCRDATSRVNGVVMNLSIALTRARALYRFSYPDSSNSAKPESVTRNSKMTCESRTILA